MADPEQFAARLRAIAEGVELNSGRAVKDAAAAALVALVRLTPVGGPPTSPRDPHPGLARSNWHVLAGEATARVQREATTEGDAVGAGLAVINGLGRPDAVTISNPVPYINKLNDGSSSQAPAGFVQAALAAASTALRRVRLLTNVRSRS